MYLYTLAVKHRSVTCMEVSFDVKLTPCWSYRSCSTYHIGNQINVCMGINGFPCGTSGKEPACRCGLDERDVGSASGSGRSPGGGHSNPLQCSCLESPMDRGAWQAAVHRVTQSQTQLKRLSMHMCINKTVMIHHVYIKLHKVHILTFTEIFLTSAFQVISRLEKKYKI